MSEPRMAVKDEAGFKVLIQQAKDALEKKNGKQAAA